MQQLTSQRKAEIPHSMKQREQRLTKSTAIPIKDMAQEHSVRKRKIINLDYHCDMALYTFLVFFEFHRPTNMRQPVNEVKCIKN